VFLTTVEAASYIASAIVLVTALDGQLEDDAFEREDIDKVLA
jgi:hypothetical protein